MIQNKPDGLWPLIPRAPGLSKAERRVMTAAAAVYIALPFLMVIMGLAGALWLSNMAYAALLPHFGLSPRWSMVVADTFKFTAMFVAGRMLWLMVPFVPELIARARSAVAQASN